MPDFFFEDACAAPAAGIDEVGRGPWAGPVLAAAVILDRARVPAELLAALADSKALSARRRETLSAALIACPGVAWATGEASVAEIDALNILQATFLAMRRAVEKLQIAPAHALIDGNKVPPGLPCPATAIVKGDAKCASIAAASIIAKVARDRIMLGLDADFPNYGWCRNAGYGTAEHQAGLLTNGVTDHHRKSFAPIRKMLTQKDS
ncbi:MAG: ribonuclease HII [Rhodospirillaceae bacterium]